MPLATIPGFTLPSLHLGPVTIQSFGVLTALGVMTAVLLAARAARGMGRDPQVIMDFSVVGILTGVVMGHLVHVLGYHPEELQAGWQVLKFWEGLSSMGGLLGGILAALVWFRVKRVRFADYADALALGLAPGWGIARVGCFTVHDHPGLHTDFFLGVYIDGVRATTSGSTRPSSSSRSARSSGRSTRAGRCAGASCRSSPSSTGRPASCSTSSAPGPRGPAAIRSTRSATPTAGSSGSRRRSTSSSRWSSTVRIACSALARCRPVRARRALRRHAWQTPVSSTFGGRLPGSPPAAGPCRRLKCPRADAWALAEPPAAASPAV